MKARILALVLVMAPIAVAQADGIVEKAVKWKVAEEIVSDPNDSTMKKAAKLHAAEQVAESDDSLLKKGVKLKAAKRIAKDKHDSGLKKAVKWKIVKDS